MIDEQRLKSIQYYPLTHPQKRVWHTEKIYPGSALYNIGGYVRFEGDIHLDKLEESINAYILNNDGLRLRLVEQSGEVQQYVRSEQRIKLDLLDFSNQKEPEIEFNTWVETEAKKPFVLDNQRLFYFALFRLNDNDVGFLLKFHHLIADGWSTQTMTKAICDTYMALSSGKKEELDVNSYVYCINKEGRYLLSARCIKDKVFWNDKFKVLPDIFLHKSSDDIVGKRKAYELDAEISGKIKSFAESNKCSLNTFFIALYSLYLNKATQQDEIVIGTPVLNRSGKKEKETFGMVTSTMPFKFAIDANRSLLETLFQVNDELMRSFFHQKYPYDLLLQDLELKKKGFDGLFNVCVNYYNTRHYSDLNGSKVRNVEFYNGHQIYSMQLIIKDWSETGCLTLEYDYKVKDYTDEHIEEMQLRLMNLINQAILNPHEKVGAFSLLLDDERNCLVDQFNATKTDYPKEKVIYQLFEEQTEKTPSRIAVSFNNMNFTFKEVNEKANQLSRFLIKKGVKKETIVGLLMTHSVQTVISILAVIKTGGAYVPIDHSYPTERINYMLKDSSSRILLTNLELPEGVNYNGEIIMVDDPSLYRGDSSNLGMMNTPRDLVYVLYTSGSTGNPKGTMVEHQGLLNYIVWAKKMYVKNEDDVFPLYSSLAFDLTVTSIFTPLICGAQIVIYNDNHDDNEYVLSRIMKDNKATIVKLTPSHLSLLTDFAKSNTSVERLIVGGEDLKVSLAKEIHTSFGGDIEIFNEYGPTETVVGCMIHKYMFNEDTRVSVPIGKPTDNVQIYILDKNLNPVPHNIVAELYIAGDGVARGYLNRTELTEERFINNPFRQGERMYRTGDLARFITNDNIEYIGRADDQVKIRGYRIELNEIEKYLLMHETVKETVVIAAKSPKTGDMFLCAYLVRKVAGSIHELRDFLLEYLPHYMIPAHFVELNDIPLTTNGKVDIKVLPIPEPMNTEAVEFVGSRTEIEEKLVYVICLVLNVENLSVKHNFFHIGGDSIKAIQVVSKLNDMGLKIKVKDVLSYPIIEEMAIHVEYSKEREIIQEPATGNIDRTPIVSWFFSQGMKNPNYYNQSVLLDLKIDIDIDTLEKAWNGLIRHHDSLRINYNPDNARLFYNDKHLDTFYKIHQYDLASCTTSQQDTMTSLAEGLATSFDISQSILIKACVFNLRDDAKRLFITAHHLVIDGVSWRIIVDDMNTMIEQIKAEAEISLSPKTDTYQKWAEMLGDINNMDLTKETDYWESVISKAADCPWDHDLGDDMIQNCNTISRSINKEETDLLLTKANFPYNTGTNELLITSLLRTVKSFMNKEDIVIELEGHGRGGLVEDIDLTRTVGWFTTIFPFHVRLKDNDVGILIKEVKEAIRKIPSEGMGFGILRYLSESVQQLNRQYIRFNYLGVFETQSGVAPIKFLSDQIGRDNAQANHLTSLFDINCFVLDGRFQLSLTYSRNKFLDETVNQFTNSYLENLKLIINHCIDKDSVEFTPTDFNTVELSQEDLDFLFNS